MVEESSFPQVARRLRRLHPTVSAAELLEELGEASLADFGAELPTVRGSRPIVQLRESKWWIF